jgi:hypothetical protein
MKRARFLLPLILILAATAAFAQSDAQKSFDKLKTLAGSWDGKSSEGKPMHIVFRVTSQGSALMSEITGYEDMITMFHLDGDRLLMTHYCATGNQPRMVGKMSADGKSVAFDFLDVTNFTSSQPGHMQQMVLSMPDANHHTEEWTFLTQDGKQMHQRFEVARAQ